MRERIFVALPSAPASQDYLSKVIKPLTDNFDIAIDRMPPTPGCTDLVDQIKRKISEAKYFLALFFDRNPNVSFEIGLAYAMNKPMFVITDDLFHAGLIASGVTTIEKSELVNIKMNFQRIVEV